MDAIVRVDKVTHDLFAMDMTGEKRKRDGRPVARFDSKTAGSDALIKCDAVAIKPRWRTGLQSSPGKIETLQRLSKLARWRFIRAPCWSLLPPDVNQSIQERTRGDDE